MLLSLVGRPGIEPTVVAVAAVSVWDGVGLSERTNSLCVLSQRFTIHCTQVSSFGLP